MHNSSERQGQRLYGRQNQASQKVRTMTYEKFREHLGKFESSPPSPAEKAERILARLRAFLAQPEAPREEHDVVPFSLNSPLTPEVDDIHNEFMEKLGVNGFVLPGEDQGYQSVGELVYTDEFGTIVRQVMNLGADPKYADCHESMVYVVYTAQRGGQLHPRVRDAGSIALHQRTF